MCNQNETELKKIEDLNNERFFVPDYQRGYRWDERNAQHLLDDIWDYHNKHETNEIYCVQPLVIKKNDEGKCRVIDGQQRLTTIKMVLGYLQNLNENCKQDDGSTIDYSIEYQTHINGKDFLDDICKNGTSSPICDPEEDIDYYHMCKVYNGIKEWFENKTRTVLLDCKDFYDTLVKSVYFIWYVLDHDENENQVFARLNDSIKLTESELIKALFLNNGNFQSDVKHEALQLQIAYEWDEIETKLQDDEFWLFLHRNNYENPTRIELIFRLIYEHELLYCIGKDGKKITIKGNCVKQDEEQKLFCYFENAFRIARENNSDNLEWLKRYWNCIKNVYHSVLEWYNDYECYHYIGYLVATLDEKTDEIDLLNDLYKKWIISRSKDDFKKNLVNRIIELLAEQKWIYDKKTNKEYEWYNFVFNNGDNNDFSVVNNHGGTIGKRASIVLLLLHNIETMIVQSKKAVEDAKKIFDIPNFVRFPFHLYHKDGWDVEHIRANSGGKTDTYCSALTYLWYIKETRLLEKIEDDQGNLTKMQKNIDDWLNTPENAYKDGKKKLIDECIEEIERLYTQYENKVDQQLVASPNGFNKNNILNYTLLDSGTNRSYQDCIFPVKRMHIIKKEEGKKPKTITVDNSDINVEFEDSYAYVLPCTKNVFTKAYTMSADNLFIWSTSDAECYKEDIIDKLGSKFIDPAIKKAKEA